MSQPPPGENSNANAAQDKPIPTQQTMSPNQMQSPPPPKTRTPAPGNVEMPTPPTYRRSPSNTGQDRGAFNGFGPSSQLTPSSEGRLSPSWSGGGPMSPSQSNNNAFVFPLRSVFANQSKSGQGSDGKPQGIQRSTSGRQLASPNSAQSSDPLSTDAGIDSIQQMLEQGSSERRERKQPSGNPGVATFSGKVQRSGSNASQVGGHDTTKPRKPASAGVPSSGIEDGPPDGFFSMPPNMVDKEPSRSPFFQDGGSRRQSIGNGQIGRSTSQKKPERPKIESRASSGSTTKVEPRNDSTPKQFTNPSTTAQGHGLPDENRAPVGQPQGPVNEINFRHRPGGDSIEASTSFSSQKRNQDNSSTSSKASSSKARRESEESRSPSTSTTRPSDRVFQQKREAIQTGIKQPRPENVGNGPMPGLANSEGANDQNAGFHLEIDEQGEHQLIQDFTGIVRLGDARSSTASRPKTRTGTGVGSGADTGSRGKASASESGGSGAQLSNRGMRNNNNRGHTQNSVLDFVESQSHTENMADPNAPTPSQAATAKESQGDTPDIPDTPPIRPVSEARRPSAQSSLNRTSVQTGSSDASATAPDSSEAATGSEEEEEDDDEDDQSSEDEEPIITFRFEHTQNTDGHHVVVGREGVLRRCEDEPITTPGAVQGFGVLIVLEEEYETGDLVVRQVSEVST